MAKQSQEKGTLTSIMDLRDKTFQVQRTVEELIEDGRQIFEGSSEQFEELADYLKTNWKSLASVLAVVGLVGLLKQKKWLDI